VECSNGAKSRDDSLDDDDGDARNGVTARRDVINCDAKSSRLDGVDATVTNRC
jgi:hypothetical protein